MNKFDHETNIKLLPLIKHTKDSYLVWLIYYNKLPKTQRYTLGQRIDNLFIEIIETLFAASFAKLTEKQNLVSLANRKTDTLKLLVMVLWETKSIDDKKYTIISQNLVEMGKMLGGWMSHLQKQNSPNIS